MSIIKDKIDVIDQAFSSFGVQSFADLGGIWGVEGAYTFHALDRYKVTDAVLVDTNISETVAASAKNYPQLRLINGNFGSQAVVDQVGRVDAIFLFDVLLHQVAPDWDIILELYAKNVRVFVIYNQQWTGSDTTVRLLNLGEKEYFRNVPADPKQEPYKNLFKKLDQKHPFADRTWRDVHSIWQWGITDHDLESTAARLGFKPVYKKWGGKFGENFENQAFIFARQ
ncbi:MAG TPA: class I SAM-dependent methyltransferase [Mycobacterium sp.]